MERYRPSGSTTSPGIEPEKKVRGRPFRPGNPGRPRGSKNRVTRQIEAMMAGEAEKITRKLLVSASDGNPQCLKLYFDHLLPKRHGRPVDIDLPPVKSLDGLAAV